MTATQWLRKFNEYLAPEGRRIVRCRANDPAWEQLGDYFMENTKTGNVALTYVSLRDIGTPLIRAVTKRREERRERRKVSRFKSK